MKIRFLFWGVDEKGLSGVWLEKEKYHEDVGRLLLYQMFQINEEAQSI